MRHMTISAVRLSTLLRLAAGLGAALLFAASPVLLAQRGSAPRAFDFAQAKTAGGPKFTVSFPATAHAGPVTGRVYVAISKTNDRSPIQQTDTTGAPLFGANIDALAPGAAATIDATTLGYPVRSLRDLPVGDYWAQAFVNVYTKFARADGHTVWLHQDQWEGQNWKISPGNISGAPVQIHWDPSSSAPIVLTAANVIPPITPPVDTDTVKYIKIQSQILTKWWGQPMYIGAIVTLPDGYATHPAVQYPINYVQGHFPRGGGGGGARGRGAAPPVSTAPQPRMISVQLQHPSPYYDDSYGVNSANNGPYGDAIMQELLPEVETKFRVIREPWARMLTGGSTGGWISLAHQIFYPDYYGGVFSTCPDGVDFRYHQIVNVYNDDNAYFQDHGWMKVERPNQRRPDGNVMSMMKDENWFELVQGDKSRSGGQWDIWEATYGPVGADGYPQRIWDKETGKINKDVAAYWKEHYDLRNILETNWKTLGPKLANKINVYVGDADSYFLNMGVHMLDEFLRKADNPKWTGETWFQPMAPHCYSPPRDEILKKMVAQITKYAPAGADLTSWKY